MLGTPTGDDYEYQLYAVAVHRGQQYSSGHYYSFVNTSVESCEPCWVRFDDSKVQLTSEDQALSFTGGKKQMISWNKEFDRFMEKEYSAEDTAYILVYFRR